MLNYNHDIKQHNTEKCKAKLKKRIAESYEKEFNTNKVTFLPNLAASSSDGSIDLIFGYANANNNPLYLEQYLNSSIDDLISEKTDALVHRSEIVEVGNLVVSNCKNIGQVFLNILYFLKEQGYVWLSFTATRMLRFLFASARVRVIKISTVDKDSVDSKTIKEWGKYYDVMPEVMIANIDDSIRQLSKGV